MNENELFKAISENDIEKVKNLVKNGVNVNAITHSNRTILIDASWKGYLEIVKCLVENGADINAKDDFGRTALIWASYDGKLGVVKYLVDKGADINIEDDKCDTALNMICSNSDNNKKYNQIKEVLMKAWQRKN